MTSRPRSLSFQGRFMFGTLARPAFALPPQPGKALIAKNAHNNVARTP
jgi:hypothetical protein